MDRIMDGDREVLKQRAVRILILVAIIIGIVLILTLIFKVVLLPSLIGTILVVCVIAFVAHKIYVSKYRSSMSTDVEAGQR